MYSVDIYNRVRHACLKDGMSAREAARYFNEDRKPSFSAEQLLEIGQLSQQGVGNNEIARRVGLSKFSVSRILQDIDAASEKLAKWGQ